jgi:hypothetical protein
MAFLRSHPIRNRITATAIAIAGSIPGLTIAALCGAAMLFAFAQPASAQITVQLGGPEVPGFSNNYPWFNDVPQYRGDQSFRYFMAYHPRLARSLSRNPGLLYNAGWRSQHPELEQYLANHPYTWRALNGEYWSNGPAETQWGDYDNGQWRDAYWWHQNNPTWFYDNHVNWASLNSRWLNQDGAYDDRHQWHYGEWWYNQNPGWVRTNHPTWLTRNQRWESPAVQQRYREQHPAIQGYQPRPNRQPQHANVQQQNSSRTIDQRPTNLEQQPIRPDNRRQQRPAIDERQSTQEQQPAVRQENRRRQQSAIDQRRTNVERQQANREQAQTLRQENRQAARQSREQHPGVNRQDPTAQRNNQGAVESHGHDDGRTQ